MKDISLETSSPLAEPEAEEFPFGQFWATPIAEQAADGTWRAGVSIRGGDPGTPRPDKCAFPQAFFSRREALRYATDQCEQQSMERTLAGSPG